MCMHLVIARLLGPFADAWSLMQGAESQLGLEEDGEVEKPAPGQCIRRIRANCSGRRRGRFGSITVSLGEGVVQSEGGEKC